MYRPLSFTPTYDAATVPVLGGTAWLDARAPWPTSIHRHPLLHLASFPTTFIRNHVPGLDLAPGLIISVFTPYLTSGEQRFEEAMNHGGRVIAHWPGREPTPSPCAPIGPLHICAGTAVAEGEAPHGGSKIGGRPYCCRMTNRRAKCSPFNSTNSILIRQLRRIEESWSGGWAICCLIATFPHLRKTAVDSSSRRLEGRAKSVARHRPAMTYQTGQEQVIAGSALNAIGLIHVQRTCIRKLWPSSGLRFLGRRPIPVSRYSLALRRQGKANASSCEPACAVRSSARSEDRYQSESLRFDFHTL